MKKLSKKIAGIGLCAMMATGAIFGAGCADMTNAQIEDAMSTATKAEQTLEELKDLYETQIENQNEQIEKLQAELDEFQAIMQDKSGDIALDKAEKMIQKSLIDFEVMSDDVRNVTMQLKVKDASRGSGEGIYKVFIDDENKVYDDRTVSDSNQTARMTSYGDKDSYVTVYMNEKTIHNYSIFSTIFDVVWSSSTLGAFRHTPEIDIISAYKNAEGISTIVAIYENDDEYRMYTIKYDNCNRLIELEINTQYKGEYGSINGETYCTTDIGYASIKFAYGEITQEEVDARIAEIEAMP